MDTDRFSALTTAIVAHAARDLRVVGVVGVGSTAGDGREPDGWSDHDLVVIAADRAAARALRETTDWLPPDLDIVVAFPEPDHGLSVLLADGHLLEFAVAGVDDLHWFGGDRTRVLHGDGTVAALVDDVVAATAARAAAAAPEDGLLLARFVKELVVGLGRAARGEHLSANERIRSLAPRQLVTLLWRAAPEVTRADLHDPYDPLRRFEQAFPVLAEQLASALDQPLVDAAAALLAIAERELPGRFRAVQRRDFEPAHAMLARVRGV